MNVRVHTTDESERCELASRQFYVEYVRAGTPHRLEVRDGLVTRGDAQLRRRLPTPLLRKWMFCRSLQVDEKDCGVCYH
jgi:hypothetical protein